MEQLLQTQVGIGFLAVWVIQKLKAAGWLPFISDDTGGLNRFLSALAAAAATAGITWSYDPSGGALTLTGLTLANGLAFLWTLLSQGAIQEILYKSVFKKATPAPATPVTPVPAK